MKNLNFGGYSRRVNQSGACSSSDVITSGGRKSETTMYKGAFTPDANRANDLHVKSIQVVLAADCSAVTSRMYVTYVRHVCVTTHAPYRGDVTYVTTHALNRGDRACALRHVFFFF